MPRFLNTATGQFVIKSLPVEYAILSHTWRSEDEGGEQTYRDIREIQELATKELQANKPPGDSASLDADAIPAMPSILSRPDVSCKVRNFCKIAHDAGYDLAWLDTCCIDQTSSAELSEAINSMYAWYQQAAVCYVYLCDVSGDDPEPMISQFRESRWHRRGWTLQELIAPTRVIFLTKTWESFGTKSTHIWTLAEITGIRASILAGRQGVEEASVAERMSWAARRRTTRIEDEAYSLLGLFGLYMSPIYGEGANAFIRLQEQIVRNVPDLSIFAWGLSIELQVEAGTTLSLRDHPAEESTAVLPFPGGYWSSQLGPLAVAQQKGLLAPTPADFRTTSDIIRISPQELANFLGVNSGDLPFLHCVFTPQGANLQLPCLGFRPSGSSSSPHDNSPSFIRLAFLQCRVRDGPFLALPLSHDKADGEGILHVDRYEPILTTTKYRTLRISKDVLNVALRRGWEVVPSQDLRLLSRYLSPNLHRRSYGPSNVQVPLFMPHPTIGQVSYAAVSNTMRLDDHSTQELRASGFHVLHAEYAQTKQDPQMLEITFRATVSTDPDRGSDRPLSSPNLEVSIAVLWTGFWWEDSRTPQWSSMSVGHVLNETHWQADVPTSDARKRPARYRGRIWSSPAVVCECALSSLKRNDCRYSSIKYISSIEGIATMHEKEWKGTPFHKMSLRVRIEAEAQERRGPAGFRILGGETLFPSSARDCLGMNYVVHIELKNLPNTFACFHTEREDAPESRPVSGLSVHQTNPNSHQMCFFDTRRYYDASQLATLTQARRSLHLTGQPPSLAVPPVQQDSQGRSALFAEEIESPEGHNHHPTVEDFEMVGRPANTAQRIKATASKVLRYLRLGRQDCPESHLSRSAAYRSGYAGPSTQPAIHPTVPHQPSKMSDRYI